MERPGSDLISENHSVLACALWSNLCWRKLKTELCKGYPVYGIVPSVCPDPGQLVWTSVWQSISKGITYVDSFKRTKLVAKKGNFFSLTIWVFLWESISDFRWIWRCGIQSEWWPDVLEDNSNLKPHQPGIGQKSGRQHGYVGRTH